MSVGPGIHEIPPADYHDDPADTPSLSKSIAHLLITQSPAHAKVAHPRLNPDLSRDDDPKFDVGTVCHALFLEGRDIVEVLGYGDWRTAAAKEARQFARQHGRIPLLTEQWAEVERMVAAIKEQLAQIDFDPPLFTAGKPEQTLIWDEDGVTCRALVDWLRDDLAAVDDLKTTRASANPEAWSRTLFNIGADLQVAFYLRGLKALTGAEPEFRFLVAECAPPYAISVVSLAPSALALANDKIDYALATWKRCLATGTWPAYAPRIAYVEAPGWAESQWLEREAREEAAA